MTLVKLTKEPFAKKNNSYVDDFFFELPSIIKSDWQHNQWKGFVPVNIIETENNYSLEVVAPGFEKNDFKVNLEQNVLTISAERKEESKDENKKQIRQEYNYRSFKRSFTLDEKINAEGIAAQYVNGVLTLNLPKKETVKETKNINIQ